MNASKQSIWNKPDSPSSEVYLRLLAYGDEGEFIDVSRTSKTFLSPWIDAVVDSDEFADKCARQKNDDYAALLVCLSADDRIIGNINISQIARGNFCSAYLGYRISPEFAGKGLMRMALTQLVQTALGPYALHRLEANIQPENIASKKLVEKVGFKKEGYSANYLKVMGEWRDHERWAITADDS